MDKRCVLWGKYNFFSSKSEFYPYFPQKSQFGRFIFDRFIVKFQRNSKEVNDMKKTKYNVALRTPIGTRMGVMDIQVHQGLANGIMHILGKAHSFTGVVDENGRCRLSGKFETLRQTVFYDADGMLTNNKVDLSIQSKVDSFRLIGEACE